MNEPSETLGEYRFSYAIGPGNEYELTFLDLTMKVLEDWDVA